MGSIRYIVILDAFKQLLVWKVKLIKKTDNIWAYEDEPYKTDFDPEPGWVCISTHYAGEKAFPEDTLLTKDEAWVKGLDILNKQYMEGLDFLELILG